VRYLDFTGGRKGENDAFTVTVSQNGKTVGTETLNKASLRLTEEGIKKWGWGHGHFVWQRVAFSAEKGKATLSLSKPVEVGGNRIVDLFIVTRDEQYEADVVDVYPVYLKARILPEQDRACVLTLGGRRSAGPRWSFLYTHIYRDGITNNIGDNIHEPQFPKLQPGESTPWIPLHKQLTFHRRDMMTFSAMAGRNDPVTNAAFELLFSKTPDNSGVFRKETRRGSGSGIVVNINLVTGEMLNDREGSAQSIAWAKATKPVDGAVPKHYPFFTFMDLSFDLSQGEFVENELKALNIIGVNGLARNYLVHTNFPFGV
jgi:hypothetical protein